MSAPSPAKRTLGDWHPDPYTLALGIVLGAASVVIGLGCGVLIAGVS